MSAALHTLLEHAERRRDEALAVLAEAEGSAGRLRAQAEQLRGYRDEYRERHPARAGRVAPIDLLRCYGGFMHRLEQALEQQQAHERAAAQRVAALRAELVGHETRVAAVRKLIERRDAVQHHAAARLEQRRSDDAAHRRGACDGHASPWHATAQQTAH